MSEYRDYAVRATAAGGYIRAFAATTRNLTEKARGLHNTSPVVTAALGRLLTAGCMMGLMMKGDRDILTIQVKGDGPVHGLTVTADSKGRVKGFADQPAVLIPANSRGKLDVGGAVGRGSLTVIKDLGLKEPYSGQVPIVSGEIAEDITNYFAVSEQTPTVCALGVLVNPDLTVRAAGGFLVQLLPFADENTISTLEKNIRDIPPVSSMIDQGITPEKICMRVLEGLEPQITGNCNPSYHCDCSRERVQRAVISLGRQQLSQLIEEDHGTEVCCHFCGKKYRFSEEELKEILQRATH